MSLGFSSKRYRTKLWSEKCTGGKHIKVILTGMSAVSATGEKLPRLVIGRMFQEREVFTMHLQGTGKKLDGLRALHRLDQTVGSKISSQES